MSGAIVASPTVTYHAVTTSVVRVSTSGLVSGLLAGTSIISATYENAYDEIYMYVIATAVSQDNKIIEIKGKQTISYGFDQIYSSVFKNNGVSFVTGSVYSITADDGATVTSLATIVTQDATANTCTIRCSVDPVDLGQYFWLKVTNTGGSITNFIRIRITALF